MILIIGWLALCVAEGLNVCMEERSERLVLVLIGRWGPGERWWVWGESRFAIPVEAAMATWVGVEEWQDAECR